MKITKIILLSLFFQANFVSATESLNCNHRWWLNLSGGVGAVFGNKQINPDGTSQVSFNGMITDNLFLTAATTRLSKENENYKESAREGALMLGYKKKHSNWYWTAAAGIGVLNLENQITNYTYTYWGNSFNYTAIESKDYISIPMETQLFWTPFKHFGVGMTGHISLGQNTLVTALLGIQIS